ncbi:unnamed protein product [Lactuca virosa]|uniref:Uncharacterized protein n=1 Tax=Lactuca virosa TaxID=75947 RepID=A0AAU9MYH4_9ASTR|nr:unnamed protein product [Lactuca virosa]
MLGMMAEQQLWRINLQAKAKNIHFKLKASKYLPTCYNFFRFSLFLKISHLLIRLSSDNNPTTKRKSLKSRISGAIQKFRRRITKRTAFSAQKPSKIKRLKLGSFESIYQKDRKGIIIHGLSVFKYLLTQIKIFMETKANKLLLLSILAMMGYLLWLRMKNHLSYHERTFASRYFRKVLYSFVDEKATTPPPFL